MSPPQHIPIDGPAPAVRGLTPGRPGRRGAPSHAPRVEAFAALREAARDPAARITTPRDPGSGGRSGLDPGAHTQRAFDAPPDEKPGS